METIELLGKPVADKIYLKISDKVNKLLSNNIVPKLSAILVGDDPASQIYINKKNEMFLKMNCKSEIHHFSENTKNSQLIDIINKLNKDKSVHGILIQLPLPDHLDSNKILESINPNKDVDGFHPINSGYLFQGDPKYIPCTPQGCLEIIKYYGINVKSKHVVIIGRSNIVGKPLMILLSQKFDFGNATVTICHSHTQDLSEHTKRADIIIVAAGQPKLLKRSMIKEGVIILDVGINRVNDNSKKGYYIVGDADYNELLGKAFAITPVPRGVGPMTIAMLLYNTVRSAEKSITLYN